jgi:hypothetical protein
MPISWYNLPVLRACFDAVDYDLLGSRQQVPWMSDRPLATLGAGSGSQRATIPGEAL